MLLNELKDINKNLKLFVDEITTRRKLSLVKPLSVELRKLYLDGRGNNMLKRISKELNINLVFKKRDGKKIMPPSYINCSIDEYLNDTIFALNSRIMTRKKLIGLVANQRGAHFDDKADILHAQSRLISLPLGNPKKNGIYEQNTLYLLQIAKFTINIIDAQILSLRHV